MLIKTAFFRVWTVNNSLCWHVSCSHEPVRSINPHSHRHTYARTQIHAFDFWMHGSHDLKKNGKIYSLSRIHLWIIFVWVSQCAYHSITCTYVSGHWPCFDDFELKLVLFIAKKMRRKITYGQYCFEATLEHEIGMKKKMIKEK